MVGPATGGLGADMDGPIDREVGAGAEGTGPRSESSSELSRFISSSFVRGGNAGPTVGVPDSGGHLCYK